MDSGKFNELQSIQIKPLTRLKSFTNLLSAFRWMKNIYQNIIVFEETSLGAVCVFNSVAKCDNQKINLTKEVVLKNINYDTE